jgi:hypothetical protein
MRAPAQPRPERIRTSATWLRCPQVTAKRKAGATLAILVQLSGVRYTTGKTAGGDIEVTVWDEASS